MFLTVRDSDLAGSPTFVGYLILLASLLLLASMLLLFSRAGHTLIFSRFAIRSPLNFFLWIADAHAFIFLISLFARRSNARRSTSGSLSEKG
jgi:hypothetical protein